MSTWNPTIHDTDSAGTIRQKKLTHATRDWYLSRGASMDGNSLRTNVDPKDYKSNYQAKKAFQDQWLKDYDAKNGAAGGLDSDAKGGAAGRFGSDASARLPGVEAAAKFGYEANVDYAKRFLPELKAQADLEANEIGRAGGDAVKRFAGKPPELGDPKKLFESYYDKIRSID